MLTIWIFSSMELTCDVIRFKHTISSLLANELETHRHTFFLLFAAIAVALSINRQAVANYL